MLCSSDDLCYIVCTVLRVIQHSCNTNKTIIIIITHLRMFYFSTLWLWYILSLLGYIFQLCQTPCHVVKMSSLTSTSLFGPRSLTVLAGKCSVTVTVTVIILTRYSWGIRLVIVVHRYDSHLGTTVPWVPKSLHRKQDLNPFDDEHCFNGSSSFPHKFTAAFLKLLWPPVDIYIQGVV